MDITNDVNHSSNDGFVKTEENQESIMNDDDVFKCERLGYYLNASTLFLPRLSHLRVKLFYFFYNLNICHFTKRY